MKTRLIFAVLALVGVLSSCVSESAEEPKVTTKEVTTNRTGSDGGYFYSFWTNGGGSVTMTLDGANGYRVRWTDCGNFTVGKGWHPGSGRTISYSGYFSTSGGGLFGVYGWTVEPLVEYYVCETWGEATNPATSGTLAGIVVSDGDTYDIYKHTQKDQPSIRGTATFAQYKSFRQTPRTSGTITTQNHFDAWDKLGMKLGKHDYQILLTEGFNGSGSGGATVSEVSK